MWPSRLLLWPVWGHLAPPFTARVCKWIIVELTWILTFEVFYHSGSVLFFLIVMQNATKDFKICPLSLSTHSKLRNLKLTQCSLGLFCLTSVALILTFAVSYKLQSHLLRTSKIVPCILLPQLEVTITVNPNSLFERVLQRWQRQTLQCNTNNMIRDNVLQVAAWEGHSGNFH